MGRPTLFEENEALQIRQMLREWRGGGGSDPRRPPPWHLDRIARIKDCKRSNGFALCELAQGDPPTPSVPAGAEQVYVFLAVQTFVEEGEYIFIRPFASGPTIKWYMTRPVYDPLGPCVTPTSGELASSQDNPADRTAYCDDNVVPPT